MALVNKTKFAGVSLTGMIVEDDTGNYDPVTNPTGWGSPNEDFFDYAHYLIAYKKNVNEVPDARLIFPNPDPLTTISWSLDRASDGWYYATHLHIKIWNSTTNYVTGDVVYNDTLIYVALGASLNANPAISPADWDVQDDLEDVQDAVSVLTSQKDTIFTLNADVFWSKEIAESSQQGRCGICDDEVKKDELDRIRYHINAADVACRQGKFTDGEWNVLNLIELCAK